MFGGPFENVKYRLKIRTEIFSDICENFFILIDKMPGIAISKTNVQIFDLNITLPDKQAKNSFYFFIAFLKYIEIMSKMSVTIINNRKPDIFLFTTGTPYTLPLLLLVKILGKKTVIMCGGTAYSGCKAGLQKIGPKQKIIGILDKVCFNLTDFIAIETTGSGEFLDLTQYKKKLKILGSFIYIDSNIFNRTVALEDRSQFIGYVGALSIGKGILDLFKAQQILIKKRDDLSFVIVGDGDLYSFLQAEIQKNNLQNKIQLVKWVDQKGVAEYLNSIRLLVLPSYSEGLPGIILEAMACGTPVLASEVGAITDIITDGKTGFILKSNNPQSIAESIERALSSANFFEISDNSMRYVDDHFSFIQTKNRYAEVFQDILRSQR
jgi:glycosyltransferase involved in cell wall biosynthesis